MLAPAIGSKDYSLNLGCTIWLEGNGMTEYEEYYELDAGENYEICFQDPFDEEVLLYVDHHPRVARAEKNIGQWHFNPDFDYTTGYPKDGVWPLDSKPDYSEVYAPEDRVCTTGSHIAQLLDAPNPGTDKAISQGCMCPVTDNEYGRGYMGQPGVFVYSEGCPLHVIPEFPTGERIK